MPYKPFLSHKREEADDLGLLRDELMLRGAGGWQDQRELRFGQRWQQAFKRAIGGETGGFIWWATPLSLKSWTITHIELPSALRRTRRRRGGPYPMVPLMVGLDPMNTTDVQAIRQALGRRRADQILGRQGLIRDPAENLSVFAKRAARKYVHDLVREHGDNALRIAITGGREPTGAHHLSLDWRPLLDEHGRLVGGTALPTIVETLADIRATAQECSGYPHFVVEPHLRLPLAALVGWEWNRVRPVKLTVIQQSPEGTLAVEDVRIAPRTGAGVRHQSLPGSGPAVLALSVGKDLGQGVERYAAARNASEFTHLHVDLDGFPGQRLGAEDISALSQWVVEQLTELNARGGEKHLLLLGPASLAVRIGAAANGTGVTFVPFWDGAAGYDGGVTIG